MAAILNNVTNSIWHAFTALQTRCDVETVHKSKLKVLTANIGTLLDMYGVEKGLDHYRSTPELDFKYYQFYLRQEVFSQIKDDIELSEQRSFEGKIEEVCWLICRKLYSNRKGSIFAESSVQQLFRIFCLLGDLIPDKEIDGKYTVRIDSSETALVAEHLVTSLGLTWNKDDWEEYCLSANSLDFMQFITLLETNYCGVDNVDKTAITEAIDEIYQIFIKDVIKKGILMKRGYLLPTLREFWVVLQPCELTYYKSQSEKMLCGSIGLTSTSLVESITGTHKLQKFLLNTPERTFELATQDHKSRLQWIAALQLAIKYSSGKTGYQRQLKEKRRNERKKRDDYIHEMHKTKMLLQEEVKARVLAENQAHQLAIIAQEDSKRILEMKDAQQELERLLAEETQAKRDEEIVRGLQARVLCEEWEKREELEKLQEEQRQMLAEETMKRQQFEELQRAKELQLKEAEMRLRQLEKEKQRLDNDLRLARNKIQLSENSKQILEEHLMVLSPAKKDNDGVRRAFSFMPSSNNNNAPILHARAATLKKHKRDNHISTTKDTHSEI